MDADTDTPGTPAPPRMKHPLNSILILAGTGHTKLANDIAQNLGVRVANSELKRFSDGEVSCTVNESIRGRDVFVVQSCSGLCRYSYFCINIVKIICHLQLQLMIV